MFANALIKQVVRSWLLNTRLSLHLKRILQHFPFFSNRGIKCLEHDQSKHRVKKKNDQPIRIRGNRERVLRAGKNLGYDPDQLQRLSVNKSEREENTLYSLLTEASFPWGTQCSVRQSKMC